MSNWHPPRKRRTENRAPDAHRESALARYSLHGVDAGFLGLLFVMPLFFGGRHDMGRFLLVVLSAMLALAWCLRQIALGGGSRIRSRVHWIVGITIGLVTLQLVPLPDRWMELLSPRTASLLPLWSAHARGLPSLDGWHTLSLTPSATRISLVMLLAYGLLLLTALERFRKIADIERLLNWIALASIGMGTFALVEYFSSNGLFFWFYDLPFKTTGSYPQGSFANRNHFAHFLVLGIGPLLAWILRLQRHENSHASQIAGRTDVIAMSGAAKATLWLIVGLVIVLFAIFLSLSRGGALALAVALITTLLLFHRAGQTSTRTFFAGGGLVVLMLGALSIYGYDRVAGRLDDLTSGSLDEVDSHAGRRTIWTANVAAIRAGGLFGSGAGSHRDIYRVYMDEPHQQEYTHAESGYLQIVTENGLLGAGLLFLAIGTIGTILFRAIRHQSSPPIAISTAAVAAGLAASLVHSVVDFVWFMPACMSMTLLLVACAVNLSKLGPLKFDLSQRGRATQEGKQSPKNASLHGRVGASRQWWMTVGAAVLLAGIWMTTELMGPAAASIHWDRYLRASIANKNLKQYATRSSKGEKSTIPTSHEMVTAEMLMQLQQVVHWHPDSARAHLRLASQYLQKFEQAQLHHGNAMGISQIRDAAIASDFASSPALRKWLTRAFGENCDHLYQAYVHAWRAIGLNPLQGEAYLHLANLCFLAGHQHEAIDAYMDQCLRVRPQEADVLFEVGKQHLLLGRFEKAIDYWTRAFASRGFHQIQIIQHMAGQIPAAAFIEVFHPDWQTLGLIWKRYREVGQPEDLQWLGNYAARIAETDSPGKTSAKQTHIWLTLATMQSHLDQTGAALASLQKACQAAPSNYQVRRALGFALLKTGQFHLAQSHLHWCFARKPQDKNLQAALVRAAKGRLSDPVFVARQSEERLSENNHVSH